jgi:hypothetical protein
MASRQPPAPAKRSWREAPGRPAPQSARASKAPLRWLLGLVVLGLLVAFLWLVVLPVKPTPPTRFLALLTGETDMLSAPPILFEQATVAPLAQFAAKSAAFHLDDGAEVQRTGDAGVIAARLKELTAANPAGRLIVYVSAHGISDGDAAYVLARDYDVAHPTQKRYAAADLVEAVAAVPATAKLLVFDCSHIAASARLGMAANEFGLLVAEAARQVNDPRLVVVLAGPGLETSPIGLAEGRAVLGGAVVGGLVGLADANEDLEISQAELRAYVIGKCREARVAAPDPQFLACGAAALAESDADILVRIPGPGLKQELVDLYQRTVAKGSGKPPAGAAAPPPQGSAGAAATPVAAATPAAAPAASQAATDAGAAGGPPPPGDPVAVSAPASASTGAAAPAPAAPAGSTAPAAETPAPLAATPPAPPQAAVAGNVPPILRAWRLRDKLNDPLAEPPRATWPVVYAPQLWSELNAKLVEFQLRDVEQAGNSHAAADLASKLGPYVEGLDRLVAGRPAERDGGVTYRLDLARSEFQNSDQRRRLERLDPRYVRALLELRQRLTGGAQYIQWHAARLGTSANARDAAETVALISQYLDSIAVLDDKITVFEGVRWRSREDAEPGLRDLELACDNARRLAERLAERVQRGVAKITRGANPVEQRVVESLLASDLASADQRETLLAALSKEGAAENSGSPLAAPSWNDFVAHLKLEIQLVELVDPEFKRSAEFRAVLALADLTNAPGRDQRAVLRAAGQTLRSFYADLPKRIGVLREPGASPEDGRTAERMVAVVYPRDAESIDLAALGFVAPRHEPPLEIELAAPPPTPLREGSWTEVVWKLALPNVPNARVTATIADFDERILDVAFTPSAAASSRGAAKTFAAQGDLDIPVFVRPKGAVDSALAGRTQHVQLQVEVAVGAELLGDRQQAAVVLPRPNRVELTVATITPPLVQSEPRGVPRVELQPFPNRTTTFALSLTNYTEAAKNLRVELYRVPEFAGPQAPLVEGGWPPGRLFDGKGQLPEELKTWAKLLDQETPLAASELELPADERPHVLALKPPSAAAAASAPAADGAAPAPAAEPKPVAAVDVTYGLALRLTHRDRPDDVMIKWIEVAPLRPASYFEFDPPRLDERGLVIAARPVRSAVAGGRELPPEIGEKPVSFVIRGDGTVFPAGVIVDPKFRATDPQIQLEIRPNPQLEGVQTVAIDVDGVPRAVQWDVNFELQSVTPNESPRNIRIMRVAMRLPELPPPLISRRTRMYRTAPFAEYPPIDPKEWPTVATIGDDRAASFDVSRGDRPPVLVRLQVDAPWSAFTRIGDGSYVRLRWNDDSLPSYNLYFDRFLKSELTFTDAGELVVQSQVDDFEVELPAPGVNTKVVQLTAQLMAKGIARSDYVNVAFDQSPPTIDSIGLGQSTVYPGTPTIEMRPVVTDLSAIESVEIWFTPKQRPRTAEELPPLADVRLDRPEVHPRQPEFEVTRDVPLRVKPPQELGDYYVTMRVTDASGQFRDTLQEEHVLRVIPKPIPVVRPPDLKGQVVLAPGMKPAPGGLKITVEKKPSLAATTKGDGTFVIPQVEPGDYKLIVDGVITNREVHAEHEVTLAKPPDWQVTIPLTIERADPPEEQK